MVSGRMQVVMDAEVVGEEPCVLVDFGEFADYAKSTQLADVFVRRKREVS